ncbi:hypothetical protein C8F01DRAFT_439119 [Mycena amicta]|nr:hypothetical protein C8F01DRAFT_439119 [Mycena amicta]
MEWNESVCTCIRDRFPLATMALSDAETSPSQVAAVPAQSSPCRPLLIYTRPQLLRLQSSPLVKPPTAMPELKHWFGDHEPSQSKKDSEPSTPNSARERRFRRDAEDGETSSRPSFRSTLSQPSQMGNFKHQSLRERERDRDADKERERDLRDKEGQERLRNLSDKYDRDRLAAPGLRSKERDIAPHLAVEAATRSSAQLSTPPRRGEREPRDGTKKKAGESSEDWRRGNPREAEAGRPRARDSSRSRRDASSSRRERDRDEDKDDHRRSRDDRKTRDEHRRERDRDVDKDKDKEPEEGEDPRRWRDDGKRDERMASRRAADRQANAEKASQENGDGDKRWTVVEERDGRAKRNHRDRRAGGADEVKDKEDRRERDREKEPAWMDTYIPESSGSTGILGGKAVNGELDGIQAWKKGIKEKEKAATAPKKQPADPAPAETPMDEIQLFRMMMKREEDKKVAEGPSPDSSAAPQDVVAPPGIPTKASLSQIPKPVESTPVIAPAAPPPTNSTPAPIHDPTSLLSILAKAQPVTRSLPLINPTPNVDRIADPPPASSRFFPNPINPQNSTASNDKAPITEPPPTTTQFNPPAGSRVLAFGARSAAKPPSLPQPLNGLAQPEPTSSVLLNASALSPDLSLNQAPGKTEALRSGFSPFDDPNAFADPHRRTERSGYGLVSEAGGGYSDSSVYDPSAGGYASGKGSRFAKFFDSKNRETPVNQNPVGFTSPSPNPSQRDVGYNSMDHRAIDGLLSKLNSSAQIQRPNVPSTAFSQQAQHNLQLLQQQQQQQQQQHQHQQQQLLNNRLDSLYDSRLDDRFVPDGMVPGLRSAPPPRTRDMYSDSLEDTLYLNQPRLAPQQHHRGLDPMFNPVYSQQGGRNAGIPIQPQFRGAPSPISNGQQQRLPPGLANLGGRPPLEGSQFMGMPGLPSHAGLHPQQQQQQFANNFGVNGYGGLQPQMRGVPPAQLQGNLHQLANLGHANPALLGLGIRGGFGGQHALQQQQQQELLRQQRQQQQLPPHMLGPQGTGQPDLMALLMGAHRD